MYQGTGKITSLYRGIVKPGFRSIHFTVTGIGRAENFNRYIGAPLYINRKNFHSIQLQPVCDCDRFFTDVYCAFPGSVHDALVLRNSPLQEACKNNETDMFPGDSYIMGDTAYPLKT